MLGPPVGARGASVADLRLCSCPAHGLRVLGMAMFLLVWMLSEKSTRPIAASMDNKHPRNYSHPDEAPGVDHARCWGQT